MHTIFNSKAFIDLTEFPSLEAGVQYVLQVDANEALRQQYLAEPVFRNNKAHYFWSIYETPSAELHELAAIIRQRYDLLRYQAPAAADYYESQLDRFHLQTVAASSFTGTTLSTSTLVPSATVHVDITNSRSLLSLLVEPSFPPMPNSPLHMVDLPPILPSFLSHMQQHYQLHPEQHTKEVEAKGFRVTLNHNKISKSHACVHGVDSLPFDCIFPHHRAFGCVSCAYVTAGIWSALNGVLVENAPFARVWNNLTTPVAPYTEFDPCQLSVNAVR